MSNYSTQLLARAQTVIPGGVNSPVRNFKGVGGDPLFFKRGEGPYLVSVDDQRYVDFVGSWGPLILGHAHPKVIKAVHEAVALGLSFGATTPIEIEMAELITQYMPSIESIRMVNSGTEATQSAIRLARGATGRNKIIKFEGCYHGHADCLLVKAGSGLLTFGIPNSAGVPEAFTQHTLIAPFNDLKAVEALFTDFGDDIAAVIVEPIAGNMNCVLPTPEFLPGLSKLCQKYGSIFILDEVITGFRVGLGGAQGLYGITPDLTCLGKIIGGGLPVGAFGGKKEIMDYLAPMGPVYQAGTLSGNPVTLTAGLATLRELTPELYKTLEERTKELLQGMEKRAKAANIPFKTHQAGSLFGLFFSEEREILNYTQVAKSKVLLYQAFFHGMLKGGCYFAPSAFESGFVSLSHTQAEIEFTLENVEEVFAWMSKKMSEKMSETQV